MNRVAVFVFILLLNIPLLADFKIMGGINFSRYKASSEFNLSWDYKWGLAGGVGLEKDLTSLSLLEFNFMFIQKGTYLTVNDSPGAEARYSLNTMSLPILLRKKFFFGSSPYVVGGGELSLILSHKVKEEEAEEALDIKEHTKFLDYGYILGCGWEIKLKEHLFFFIETRYFCGLRNILKDLKKGEERKTQCVLLILGLRS